MNKFKILKMFLVFFKMQSRSIQNLKLGSKMLSLYLRMLSTHLLKEQKQPQNLFLRITTKYRSSKFYDAVDKFYCIFEYYVILKTYFFN